MTYFLSFRTKNVGGAVVDPYLLEGDGTIGLSGLLGVSTAQFSAIFAGKNVLFATHGFNVSYEDGVAQLGWLDRHLGLSAPNLFIGMLWPGDSWLPVVNYPFEGDDARECGIRLADFCNTWCTGAQSLSFLSHSLGARLVLEAVARLNRRAKSVCLAAAAVNRDCLTTEYRGAAENAVSISILASQKDLVLKYAFTIGDPFADLLHDDTSSQAALGYKGPPVPPPPSVLYPWQIPNAEGYGHGNYLPPPDAVLPPAAIELWPKAARFMKCAFLAEAQSWPV